MNRRKLLCLISNTLQNPWGRCPACRFGSRKNGALTFVWFPVKLPKDPFELYRKEILSIAGHVGYFVTPLFHYYGVIHLKNASIVIGPTSQVMANEQDLRELAFKLDVPKEDVPAFIADMNGITHLPVETLLSMLCKMNHFLNGGETLAISDVAIFSEEQQTPHGARL